MTRHRDDRYDDRPQQRDWDRSDQDRARDDQSGMGRGYGASGDMGRDRWDDRYGRQDERGPQGYGDRATQDRPGGYGMGRSGQDDRWSGDAGQQGRGDWAGSGRAGQGAQGNGQPYGSGGMARDRYGQGYGGGMSDRYGQAQRQDSYRGRGPSGYQRSDDRIREDVNDALEDDDHVDASEITVQVQSGEATLTGTVRDRTQKRAAEDCVERVRGVKDVHNQIRVQSAGMQGMSGGAGQPSGTGAQAGASATPSQSTNRTASPTTTNPAKS